MINGMSVLGFIPARGGSKGLPYKNILKLEGKELIGYTIEAAIQSKICDEVVVSTDSDEIAEVSKRFGATVPFKRPSKLAGDDSLMVDVIMHTTDWFKTRNREYDIFLYLQPTSPFRNKGHIQEAFDLFFYKNADVIISVNETESTPDRINTLPRNHRMNNFINLEAQYAHRQEMEKQYELNGAIHIAKWGVLEDSRSWYVKNSYAYIMDRLHALDIDTGLDFAFAQFLLEDGRVGSDI